MCVAIRPCPIQPPFPAVWTPVTASWGLADILAADTVLGQFSQGVIKSF
jgi:hypothetical protein